jgi:hypothetical protein
MVLAASTTTAARASTPTTASGTFDTFFSSFNNSGRPARTNVIITNLTAHVSYAGTVEGTSMVQGTLIIHADGSGNFHDVEIFTGTVDGVYGTVTLNLNGTGTPAGVIHATDVIVDATGALAGLHGVLVQAGTVGNEGPVGSYTGQIQLGAP